MVPHDAGFSRSSCDSCGVPADPSSALSSASAATVSCGANVSGPQAPASGGALCITGAVWIDHASSFSLSRSRGADALRWLPAGREHAVGLRDAVELERHRHRPTGKLTIDAGGSLLLHSSTTCNGGGPSEIDTRGGIVNNGTVVAATSGQLGDQKWAIGGQRTIGGSFLNKGSVVVDSSLALIGPGTFQNDGSVTAGTYAAPQGQEPEILTRAVRRPPARALSPSSTAPAGRSTSRAGTRAPTTSPAPSPSTGRTASSRRAARRRARRSSTSAPRSPTRARARPRSASPARPRSAARSRPARCSRSATRTAAAQETCGGAPIVDTAPEQA